jgi:hypothetical protein
MSKEALRLALEALYGFIPYLPLEHDKPQCDRYDEAITAIKTALEAKDEPVAWISPTELLVMRGNALGGAKDWRVNVGLKPEDGDVGLYTTPPQRTWVGLDEEDYIKAYELCDFDKIAAFEFFEAKLKEKNNG